MAKITLSATLQQELEITLETALMLSEPGVSVPILAERIYDSEFDLMDKLKRPWIVKGLKWLLYRKQKRMPAEDQLTFEGFPTLPRRMTLKNGRRPFLMQGNIMQLQEFREVLLRRRGARLATIEKLIALMAPYAEERAGITVAEVLIAERGKREQEKG